MYVVEPGQTQIVETNPDPIGLKVGVIYDIQFEKNELLYHRFLCKNDGILNITDLNGDEISYYGFKDDTVLQTKSKLKENEKDPFEMACDTIPSASAALQLAKIKSESNENGISDNNNKFIAASTNALKTITTGLQTISQNASQTFAPISTSLHLKSSNASNSTVNTNDNMNDITDSQNIGAGQKWDSEFKRIKEQERIDTEAELESRLAREREKTVELDKRKDKEIASQRKDKRASSPTESKKANSNSSKVSTSIAVASTVAASQNDGGVLVPQPRNKRKTSAPAPYESTAVDKQQQKQQQHQQVQVQAAVKTSSPSMGAVSSSSNTSGGNINANGSASTEIKKAIKYEKGDSVYKSNRDAAGKDNSNSKQASKNSPKKNQQSSTRRQQQQDEDEDEEDEGEEDEDEDDDSDEEEEDDEEEDEDDEEESVEVVHTKCKCAIM